MLHDISSLQNDGSFPLHAASLNGRDEMVAVLLSNGANINQSNNKGSSPLHHAAAKDNVAVVAALLSNGADVNQVDYDWDTAIDVAKNQEIKDMLIAHTTKKLQEEELEPGQAVPKLVDESQWFRAAKKGELAVIQQGINDKIDVNCKDSKGRTAVCWAASEGRLQLVEYLTTQHADLSIANVSADNVILSNLPQPH